MYGEHAGWMGIGMWLFWIILIVIVLLIIKAVTGTNTTLVSRENPMDILNERYARGEINEDEFDRRKQKLKK